MTYGLHDALNLLNELCRTFGLNLSLSVNCVCPVSRNVDLNECCCTCVNSLLVHLNDFFTLLHELLCLFLHVADSLVNRKNLCKSKESGLKNCICTLAKADLCGNVNSVNCIKLNIVLCDVLLGFCIHLLSKLSGIPLAVDKEYSARLNVLNHLVTLFNI